MVTYYIRLDTYWQGSGDYFVGPFQDAVSAGNAIDAAVNAEGSLVAWYDRLSSDVKDGVRVWGVLTKTQAVRAGLSTEPGRCNLLGTEMPLTRTDLLETVQYVNQW
jgi:hypothetical protein